MSSVGSAGLSERSAGVGAFTGTAAGTSFAMRAENLITALYQADALGLTRLAHVMLSDAGAAEDVARRPSAASTRTGPGLPIRQRRCRTCEPRCSTAAGQRSGRA